MVGRFKGGHVRFHGKLKKPVLMRRSGAGSIKESSTRPMSKSEAATLPASQVPPGIPVTAVNSDGEEEYSEAGERRSTLAARTNGSRDPSRKAHNSPERSDALPSRNGGLNQANNKKSVASRGQTTQSWIRRG